MPIFVFRCVNDCGSEVERIITAGGGQPPAEVVAKCAKCGGGMTRFLRVPTAAAVLTAKTAHVASRNDYRRKHPNAKANILKGLTADGRPMTDLRKKSAEEWAGSLPAKKR